MLLFRMIFKKFISEQRDRFYHHFMIDLLQIWLLPKWFIVSNIIHIFLCGNGKIIYCNILWYAAWNVNTNTKAMYGFLFVSSALCLPPVRIIPSKFSSYKMQIMMKIIFSKISFYVWEKTDSIYSIKRLFRLKRVFCESYVLSFTLIYLSQFSLLLLKTLSSHELNGIIFYVSNF